MKIIQINPILEDTDEENTVTCVAVFESPEHAVFEMNRQYGSCGVSLEEFENEVLAKHYTCMGYYFDKVENGNYSEKFIDDIPCGITPEWVAAKAGVS